MLYGLPMVWIVLTSFKSTGDAVANQASVFFQPTVDAYVAVLTNGGLLPALAQSVLICASTTALALAIAIPAAYALSRMNGRLATVLLGLLIVLQMVPQTANVIPLFQLFSNVGLLDQTAAVILADTALLTPFAILLLRPFFRAVPAALEEAAYMDGASSFRSFRSVALPLATNGIATAGTFVFLIAWGEFLYAVNFFISPEKYPLSAILAQQVSVYGINWPGLMAVAVVTSLPILLLFVFTYRFLREGLTMGAVK
ncbi:carbohydrate ABC transporter permease [Naasia aerilata]|uniref:Sugar ABC transporter permease n=1 Tax=Naasia aerilata TaxID=1162966 RepID=A0ABM8GGI6_9MICO|nr:carbohydrate ABC transporter permease [Naasia aerilata]BDZ47469.1 sugar ABC transporter permease [Naasia aerilata]